MIRHLIVLIMLNTLLMCFSGCATTQSTRFYLLSSLHHSKSAILTTDGKSTFSLGIGPVTLPNYLSRPQIITRTGSNTLNLAEFHNWAEQLETNIAQVLAENLSILLETDQIELFPWKRQDSIDYQLVVDVLQFEGNQAGEVQLLTRWNLLDGKGQPLLPERKSLVTAQQNGQDYESLVAAMSTTLADFSRETAETIHSLTQGKK